MFFRFSSLLFGSILLFAACERTDADRAAIDSLKTDILALQSEIRAVSNELAFHSLNGNLDYTSTVWQQPIASFTEKRNEQKQKVEQLQNDFGEVAEYETLICADFEEADCFVDNWEVRKPEAGVVELSDQHSYNQTQSLRLSSPYVEGAFNQPVIEIEGYANGIAAQTIYKVRFWAKLQGQAGQGNGPILYAIALQDGEWLDYLYVGSAQGQQVDRDWTFYSFQIATLTDSPLEIILGSEPDNCFIDDIHVVAKTD